MRDVANAQNVFVGMNERNIASWNSLITKQNALRVGGLGGGKERGSALLFVMTTRGICGIKLIILEGNFPPLSFPSKLTEKLTGGV